MQTLASVDVDFYKTNGYYLNRNQVFSPEKLAKLTTLFEEHLAEKGAKLSDELDTPHFRDSRLLEFLLAPEALDLVEPLIGPNIALFSSHFISKDPFTGRSTPWHEDSTYWKTILSRFDKIVTIWLAIDPATEENGCMRVLPGTHSGGFSNYVDVDSTKNTFNLEIADVDDSKAVYFELERGQCSLHDSRIIHGAKANTSPMRRCGYTMRYFATDALFLKEAFPTFKLWLARGVDIAGNEYENA